MVPVDFCEEYSRCESEFERLDQLGARNSLKRSCTINNHSRSTSNLTQQQNLQ
jgi:hypothetical protein